MGGARRSVECRGSAAGGPWYLDSRVVGETCACIATRTTAGVVACARRTERKKIEALRMFLRGSFKLTQSERAKERKSERGMNETAKNMHKYISRMCAKCIHMCSATCVLRRTYKYHLMKRETHLSWMKPLKGDGNGFAPAPPPLAVPCTQAPHIVESPYCALLRATAAFERGASSRGGREGEREAVSRPRTSNRKHETRREDAQVA